jgi:hemin uptake protein HemP
MRTSRLIFLIAALITPLHVFAQASMLRVACGDGAARAEVSINGVFKGECPIDVQVLPGTVQIRATRQASEFWELAFVEEFRIGDAVVKRVEVVLAATQLNAAGLQRAKAELQERISSAPAPSHRVAKAALLEGRHELIISDHDGANAQRALSSPRLIALPLWSVSRNQLTYLSLETGSPVFYVQELITGVRKTSAYSASIVAACTAEIDALQGSAPPADGKWLMDDWTDAATGNCPAYVAAALW